jgi:methylmalonyl-CoA/ethylmalonyl-CoA epimerase
VHHIDVVVRDLDEAARRYEAALAIRPGPREQLPDRGVDLIRFRVGQTWLVLVQPTGSGGPVSEFLQANGEGFYHIGVEFEDVVAAASAARDRGLRLNEPYPRSGLDGWKLVDVAVEDTSGAMLQLVEVPEG